MLNPYRETWRTFYTQYSWPHPDEIRYEERVAVGWDNMRMFLLERIYRWMADADAFAIDLETILAARVGDQWWREEKIGEVERFLDALLGLPIEP